MAKQEMYDHHGDQTYAVEDRGGTVRLVWDGKKSQQFSSTLHARRAIDLQLLDWGESGDKTAKATKATKAAKSGGANAEHPTGN